MVYKNDELVKLILNISEIESKLVSCISAIFRINERIDEIDKKLTTGNFRVYQDQLYDSRD